MKNTVIEMITFDLKIWNGIADLKLGENDKLLEMSKKSLISSIKRNKLKNLDLLIEEINKLTFDEINLPIRYHAGHSENPYLYYR